MPQPFEYQGYICSVKGIFFLRMAILLCLSCRMLYAQDNSVKPLPGLPNALIKNLKKPKDSAIFNKSDSEICRLDVSRSVLARLDSQAYINFKANFINGYRIIIYSGNNREDANKAKENAYQLFPRGNVYMTYNFPTFKVRFGNFITRFSAWLAFSRMRLKFPNAMVSEEIVFINP